MVRRVERKKPEQKTRTRTKKPNKSFARWCDEWKMAAEGVFLASRKPKFLVTVLLTFLFFGTLMNLLTNGFSTFRLMAAVDFGGKLELLGQAFLATFGVGRNFWDFLFVFVVALLQGILIGLVAFVWRSKQTQKKAKVDNAANAQSAGIAAGLAVLSSGCPTCGTTLLAPVVGAVSSTGGYAVAGIVSGVIFIIAIVVALFAAKKVGCEAYAIMVSERYWRKKNA